MVIYTSGDKDFQHHVHERLQRRIRIFLIIGTLMLLTAGYDIFTGVLTPLFFILSVVLGAVIGVMTSRIFHLSWDKDGEKVVGRIDSLGWWVLAAYIVFEVGRSLFFEIVLRNHAEAIAITFAFVSAALVGRVFGLRGRILRILADEKVFG